MSKHFKLDLHKKYHSEYVMSSQPVFVVVSPARYLGISGHGAPGGEHFKTHVSAIYAVAYALRTAEKLAGHDFKVCHLEGQWWAHNEAGLDFRSRDPKEWEWRLLIRVPEFITQKDLDAAIQSVLTKAKNPLAGQVKLEELTEGRCVQVMHVGPYTAEKSAIEKIRAVAEHNGIHLRGPHHEIYLSDPNRISKERLRTLVRYPIE